MFDPRVAVLVKVLLIGYSIPTMLLLDLLTTTRLGFDGSVMKKHWSTWEASTHGSFFAVTFAPAVLDLASGITMVVKYRHSFRTLLAHLTRNIVVLCSPE